MHDTSKFFLGKNKVMIKALGRSAEDEIQDNTMLRPGQPRKVTDSFPQINEYESPENDEPSTSQVKKSSSSNQFH